MSLIHAQQEDALMKKLMRETPNYQLVNENYSLYLGTVINTLIIRGPKGCGKTCALILLYDKLIKSKVKTLYIDLSKFSSQRL